MKKLIIVMTVAVAMALVPGKAGAASGTLLNLSVSGTLEVWTNASSYQTQTNKTAINIASSTTVSFNNKYIYNLISNAVANASNNYSANLTSTNLPANGYIVFNINGFDNQSGEGYGTFYVTNRSKFSFPLSGYDAQDNYYSYIEFDDYDFDFATNFNAAAKGSINAKTLKGSYTENEPSVFYVHDNPYAYDDGDYPGNVFDNYMAIEIRSNIKAVWTSTNTYAVVSQSDVSTGSGSGNAVIKGNSLFSVVTGGKVTLIP